MRIDFTGRYYPLIEKVRQYAERKAKVIAFVLFLDCCLVVPSAFSNGIEFYERYAVEEKGTLEYVTGPNELPLSNRILLSCREIFDLYSTCMSRAIQTLKSELTTEKSANLKAWKLFLLGNVHFKANHLQEALEFFREGAQTAIDHKLKATLLHRLLITHIILRDMNGTLQILDTLLSNFPNYNHYDQIFFTFPVWFPDPINEIAKQREVFIETRETQRELAQVAKSQENRNEYVRLSIRLGQLYDQACPMKAPHEVVCQDALEIYHAIYREFPKVQGADHAFLEIQRDKMSYELEGDIEVHSRNVVELYGSFLKQYPESPLVKDVQEDYQQAIWALKALKVKTYGGIEILSKEDVIQEFQMNLFIWNSIAMQATIDAEVEIEAQKEPGQDAHALIYHHPFPADSYTRLLPIYSNYEEKPVALTLSIIYSAKSPYIIFCHNEIMAEGLKNKAEKEMTPEFSVTTTFKHTSEGCLINFYIEDSSASYGPSSANIEESLKRTIPDISNAGKAASQPPAGTNHYYGFIQDLIQNQWRNTPLVADAPVVVLKFRIARSGEISQIRIDKSSGNGYYDSAAQRAVNAVNPLPPFPPDISDSFLDVRFQFINKD